MQIQYLGTGAGEGIPGLFCECAVCSSARLKGGRNIRRRCSIMIDGELLIDLSPDFWAQSTAFNLRPGGLKHILITHEHAEHFVPSELMNILPPYRFPPDIAAEPRKISLYAGKKPLEQFESVIRTQNRPALRDYIETTELKPFRPAAAGDYTVTPLPARHCEGALIFLIEREGKVFLSGHDSGYFLEETWDYLAGRQINAVSLSSTDPKSAEIPNHMSLEDVITTRHRLYQLGCISPSVRSYITHISHIAGMEHDELQGWMSQNSITVAYDGLTIQI